MDAAGQDRVPHSADTVVRNTSDRHQLAAEVTARRGLLLGSGRLLRPPSDLQRCVCEALSESGVLPNPTADRHWWAGPRPFAATGCGVALSGVGRSARRRAGP